MDAVTGPAPCGLRRFGATFQIMSTLAEIEAAADALPESEKKELFSFLAARLGRVASEVPSSKSEKHRLPFPLIEGTPGVVINPTREQLDDFLTCRM